MFRHSPEQLDLVLLPSTATAREAIQSLNASARGIVLVADQERRLIGTITDGDIRRTFLEKLSLKITLEEILAQKTNGPNAKPVTASVDGGAAEWLRLMRQHQVQQIPLLDVNGKLAGLVTLHDLEDPPQSTPVRAVIMAGGTGTRLLPLTESVPKPMLPIGDRPMLEHIVTQLRDAGIQQVTLATHHLSQQITDHFQKGEGHRVRIDYLEESAPLGTAGSLRLIDRPKETLLVMNGDIMTTLDYKALVAYHQKHHADLTVAVRLYDVKVPFGVVQVKDHAVTGLIEKPTYTFAVNAGIYCVEPSACELIPLNGRFDMTELVEVLLSKNRRVVNFPIHEYWMDVGQPDDYARAQRDFTAGKFPESS